MHSLQVADKLCIHYTFLFSVLGYFRPGFNISEFGLASSWQSNLLLIEPPNEYCRKSPASSEKMCHFIHFLSRYQQVVAHYPVRNKNKLTARQVKKYSSRRRTDRIGSRDDTGCVCSPNSLRAKPGRCTSPTVVMTSFDAASHLIASLVPPAPALWLVAH